MNILLIGCGGIGKVLLELLPICEFIEKPWSFDIIDPDNLDDFLEFIHVSRRSITSLR
jgi:predicted dinucleotide-utilizing enzyme